MTRECKKCNQDKGLTKEFFPIGATVNGIIYYRHICKVCYYAQHREWVNNNKQLITKNNQDWKDANPEYAVDYHRKNKNKIKEKRNQRRKEDALFAFKNRVSTLVSASIRSYGYSKKSKTFQIVGCTVEELYNQFKISSASDLTGKQIDHICPCSQAQNEEELVKLQHYSNLQLISSKDNLTKNNKKTLEGELLCKILLNREWI